MTPDERGKKTGERPTRTRRGAPGERRARHEIPGLAKFVGTEEAARICGIEPRTVRQYAWEGLMPEPLRVGRTLLWSRDVLEEWARERRKPGRPRRTSVSEP
jgi:hypothetical protein